MPKAGKLSLLVQILSKIKKNVNKKTSELLASCGLTAFFLF